MRKTLNILASSFRLTMQELRVNKLRTSLSLIGISFGIFCIIGVLATVNSLEMNIQNQIKSLGTNTIYIDKWEYAGGPDYPWWKFVNRPEPKFKEVAFIKQRSQLVSNVAFEIDSRVNVEYDSYALQNVTMYGVSEEENDIQPITMAYGRFISENEFSSGSPVVIIGYSNAENLFENASQAIGKEVKVKGHNATIIGVIKRMGTSMIGWDYDQCLIVSYRFARQLINEDNSGPKIMVKGKDNVSSAELADELEGVMRSIRKLSPTQEDNFSLNQISSFSDRVSSLFSNINLGGWAIGILSLVVGAFGIANIMFVTVKERTAMIGIKKALGAKKRSILSEFLLEAAIICIMGGLIGLLLVFLLTIILTNVFNFPVFISAGILSLAISICILIGILAGIIPAYIASRLDPVVAIRSK
ncbi:MAG: ABC transporter permease [Bacteroidota bacterium]|jgi:putative ABC transport system permease protein|nr:ABC transporter permease [Bacteroidota bacterium]